jgi:integrase
VAGDRYEAMLLVAVMLGLRPGEVLGLPWEAIDLDERTLDIKQSLQRLPVWRTRHWATEEGQLPHSPIARSRRHGSTNPPGKSKERAAEGPGVG